MKSIHGVNKEYTMHFKLYVQVPYLRLCNYVALAKTRSEAISLQSSWLPYVFLILNIA